LECRHWRLSTIEAKHEFIKVVLQIFRFNSMVSAVEPSFEITESTVDMKRMSIGLM